MWRKGNEAMTQCWEVVLLRRMERGKLKKRTVSVELFCGNFASWTDRVTELGWEDGGSTSGWSREYGGWRPWNRGCGWRRGVVVDVADDVGDDRVVVDVVDDDQVVRVVVGVVDDDHVVGSVHCFLFYFSFPFSSFRFLFLTFLYSFLLTNLVLRIIDWVKQLEWKENPSMENRTPHGRFFSRRW